MKDLITWLQDLAQSPDAKAAWQPNLFRAADALEAQAKEIEALKSIAYSDDGAGGEGMRLYLEHHAMKAEIKALRAEKTQADDFTKAIANACQEAEKQVLALMEDEARLDWLESNPRHAQIMVEGVVTDCVFYGISCAQLVKLREAIDAARRK